jgi:putative zinc finger/helix-turn-helix YgiT family protein
VEEKAMKCVQCGAPLATARGVHRYTESGLSNVTLVNVEIRTCAACGEREVVIPKIEHLHRMIARTISERPAPLTPETIRFLRTWLGLSTPDFAVYMGVRPETVSRWESKEAGYAMPPTPEHLLRLMVANHEPVTHYPIDVFKTAARAVKPAPLKFRAPDWKLAA